MALICARRMVDSAAARAMARPSGENSTVSLAGAACRGMDVTDGALVAGAAGRMGSMLETLEIKFALYWLLDHGSLRIQRPPTASRVPPDKCDQQHGASRSGILP